MLSGEHIKRSGRKKHVPGSLTPDALLSSHSLVLQGLRVDSDPRIFFSLAASALAHVSGRVEEGQMTRERSPSQTTPELRALAIFERMGNFKGTSSSGRQGWRKRYVSQIGLSVGRRLGSE